jgi:hypothetical protein
MKKNTASSPFVIEEPLRLTPFASVNRLVTALAARLSGLTRLHRLYCRAPQAPLQDQGRFLRYVIDRFDIKLDFDRDSLSAYHAADRLLLSPIIPLAPLKAFCWPSF